MPLLPILAFLRGNWRPAGYGALPLSYLAEIDQGRIRTCDHHIAALYQAELPLARAGFEPTRTAKGFLPC